MTIVPFAMKGGDSDPAIADFSKAISLDPKRASFYEHRALYYAMEGDLKRALADFSSDSARPDERRSLQGSRLG